jgi:uncharacterized membrane protein (DUF2068 family)
MSGRPFTIVFGAVLLAFIGVSGIGAGIELLPVATSAPTGAAIGGGIVAYGIACVVSGIGLFLLRRWAWWLGTVAIVVGLVVLVWMQLIVVGAAPDAVTAVGLIVWGVTLVLLLAPATRRAARS